jgi:oxygen-independent coproporphyrinogen-3 oxidase
MDSYLNALIQDIKCQIDFFEVKEIPTAYIGGGTPSVLGEERVRFLLKELNALAAFKPQEFTIEANPESAKEGFLSACAEGGINRLSFGVQTFHDPCRLAVNRKGEAKDLEKRLSLAAKYFSGSLSCDLISGLPYQSAGIVKEDIKRLLDFSPSHISLYSLTLEDDKNIPSLPSGEEADDMWMRGKDALINAGFEHYEVSNFAKPEKRCMHNIRYWQMENWIAAGAAASATIIDEENGTARRYTYKDDVYSYIKEPDIKKAQCEALDKQTLIKETLLMGYRYCGGVNEETFKSRFGLAVHDCIPLTLERWKDKNKMLFLNAFLKDAFEEI